MWQTSMTTLKWQLPLLWSQVMVVRLPPKALALLLLRLQLMLRLQAILSRRHRSSLSCQPLLHGPSLAFRPLRSTSAHQQLPVFRCQPQRQRHRQPPGRLPACRVWSRCTLRQGRRCGLRHRVQASRLCPQLRLQQQLSRRVCRRHR